MLAGQDKNSNHIGPISQSIHPSIGLFPGTLHQAFCQFLPSAVLLRGPDLEGEHKSFSDLRTVIAFLMYSSAVLPQHRLHPLETPETITTLVKLRPEMIPLLKRYYTKVRQRGSNSSPTFCFYISLRAPCVCISHSGNVKIIYRSLRFSVIQSNGLS